MSELRETMADVVDDRAPGTTDLVVLLRNGARLYAEIEPIEDIVLATELGVDPRASAWLNVSRRNRVLLLANDQIQAIGKKFQILQKAAPHNSAHVMDRYLLMELTEKDAT